MKSSLIKTVFRWIAWILGGLMIAFFLMFAIGEGLISDLLSGSTETIKPPEMLGLALVGLSMLGLLIAFWKPLIGGLIACIGIVMFLGMDAIQGGQLTSLSEGWAFYLLFLAGFLHIVAWSMRRKGRHQSKLGTATCIYMKKRRLLWYQKKSEPSVSCQSC